jgi:ferrous iron transport protein B
MYSPVIKHAVALVGSPNSGKTTLFNWLTGLHYRTVNYPGATVEYSVGQTHDRYGAPIPVMDTPGTYSLVPKSPEERVAVEAIYSHKQFGCARLVISVVDATQLSRHLLITKQLQKAGFRVVVALTMMDLMREKGELIDAQKLSQELGLAVIPIDGRLGGGIPELVGEIRSKLAESEADPCILPLKDWTPSETEKTLQEISLLQKRVITASEQKNKSDALKRTQKIDGVLLHPVFGLVIFILIMSLLFTSIFWLAAPIMDLVDKSFGMLGGAVQKMAPHALWTNFISDGIIASFGAVMVFIPQIFILFFGISAFEDSGYLARSAALVDKPFSRFGLNGRSFVPILSGYACAIPAMMAARTINSKRERWLTLFIIPLMSCSARLPVYALLLSFLFRGSALEAGLLLAAIYVFSLVLGGVAALIANRFLKVEGDSFFMLELPIYRLPQLKTITHTALTRTKSYLTRAGLPIFIFAMLIWILTTFPRYEVEDKTERLSGSYAAKMGHFIEPVFKPMGGDWRTGVGLISAFAAREVFVSSVAVVFNVTDENETSMQQSLLAKMREAKADNGLPLFTIASVLGLILYFMIALQCLATTTMAARESGGWRFAIMQLVVFNVVAYVLAVGLVQGLRAFGVT